MEWLVLLGIAVLIWLCLRIVDRLSALDAKVENLWARLNRFSEEAEQRSGRIFTEINMVKIKVEDLSKGK